MDQATLKSILIYDPSTGEFRWRYRPRSMFKADRDWKTFNTRYAEKPCGTRDGKGYLHISYKGKFYLLHRLAWLYFHGVEPNIVDHIDRNRLNNAIDNLRNTSHTGNNLNRSANKTGRKTSKYKGVSRHRDKWQAQTKVAGVQKHLGFYETEEAAKEVYDAFMTDLHGGEFYAE